MDSARRRSARLPAGTGWIAFWPGSRRPNRLGFARIRLNAVAICGITEPEIIPLAEFARARAVGTAVHRIHAARRRSQLADRNRCCPGPRFRARLEQHYGPLVPVTRTDCQPAGGGLCLCRWPRTRGIHQSGHRSRSAATAIASASPPRDRCATACSPPVEWDARALLRTGGSDEQLAELVRRLSSSPRRPATASIPRSSFARSARCTNWAG